MDEVTRDISVEFGEHEAAKIAVQAVVSNARLSGFPIVLISVHENSDDGPFGVR